MYPPRESPPITARSILCRSRSEATWSAASSREAIPRISGVMGWNDACGRHILLSTGNAWRRTRGMGALQRIAVTGMNGPHDQPQASHQEHQHQQGVEEAGGLKVDVHVHQDSGEDE